MGSFHEILGKLISFPLPVLLSPGSSLPAYAHPGDAGLDLRASVPAYSSGGIVPIPTGVRVAIPPGYVGKVEGRSGLALRGIFPVGGVIDSSYRGEITVILLNSGRIDHQFQPGDKVAQLVLYPVVTAAPFAVDSLDATGRGEAGFGSTGR